MAWELSRNPRTVTLCRVGPGKSAPQFLHVTTDIVRSIVRRLPIADCTRRMPRPSAASARPNRRGVQEVLQTRVVFAGLV